MDRFLLVWHGLFLSIIHVFITCLFVAVWSFIVWMSWLLVFIVAVLLFDVCRGTASCHCWIKELLTYLLTILVVIIVHYFSVVVCVYSDVVQLRVRTRSVTRRLPDSGELSTPSAAVSAAWCRLGQQASSDICRIWTRALRDVVCAW